MSRRLGVILATMLVALLVMSDGAWACRCMNRLINRCGHRRVCCGLCVHLNCCQPVAPACCQPACGETKSAEVAKPVLPAASAPAVPPPAPQVSAPPVLPKPETPPVLKAEPMPEVKLPEKAVPVEVPAEPRVPAKPDITPVEPAKPAEPAKMPEKPPAPPAVPDKPAEPPKTPETPKAPDAPKAPEKPKDDPFGNADNDVKALRTWTDASGKYQIEARLVSFENGTVRLQKANGRYVRVAYDLLCSVDKDYVLNQDKSLMALQ